MGIGFLLFWVWGQSQPRTVTMPQIAAMAFADPEPFHHIAPWEDTSDWEVDMLWIFTIQHMGMMCSQV